MRQQCEVGERHGKEFHESGKSAFSHIRSLERQGWSGAQIRDSLISQRDAAQRYGNTGGHRFFADALHYFDNEYKKQVQGPSPPHQGVGLPPNQGGRGIPGFNPTPPKTPSPHDIKGGKPVGNPPHPGASYGGYTPMMGSPSMEYFHGQRNPVFGHGHPVHASY